MILNDVYKTQPPLIYLTCTAKTALEKIRIILTDDHALYRSGVKTALAPYKNIEILAEADHGQDLLDKMEYLRPDVVITGIQMPIMDGIALVPILRQRYPGIKIIMLTMVDDASIIERMITLGANAYLTKTSHSEEIYKAIIGCDEKWFFINDTVREAFMKIYLSGSNKTGFREREQQILKLLAAGETIAAISTQQDLSIRTTEAIINRMQEKAGVRDLAGLIEYAKGKHLV